MHELAQELPGNRPGRPACRRVFLIVGPVVAGAAMMILEVSGVRALAPWFGTTAAVWTNVLGVVLAALAAGGALGGRLADRSPRLMLPAGALALAGGFSAAVPWLLAPVGGVLTDASLPLEFASKLLPWGSLLAAAILLAPPVFLLGGAFPCFARLWIRDVRESGSRAGAVYALSTLGSLAGTFLPIHVLLPFLGIRATFLCSAAALLAAAALGWLAAAGGEARRGVGAVVGLGWGVVFAASAGFGGAQGLPAPPDGWHRLMARESSLQHLEVIEDREGIRSLVINESYGGYQSIWIPGTAFTAGRYYDALAAMARIPAPRGGAPRRAAVVGYGAGTLARALRAVVPGGAGWDVRGVEVDPVIRGIGQDFLGLLSSEAGGGGVEWGEDGRSWLRRQGGGFDLIAVDAFAQGSVIPFFLVTEEFFRLAREQLSPGGIVVHNVSALSPRDPLLVAVANTAAFVLGEAVVLAVPGQRNFVVSARKDAAVPEGGPLGALVAELPELAALGRAWAGAGGAVRWRYDASRVLLTDDRAPVARLSRTSLMEP